MGEARKDALRVGFDRAIKLEFHGARVSSDAGLFPYRDLDDAARLTESVGADLFDFRTGYNIRHSMTALLRQSVFSRLAGYEDTNDAERLSEDPVMRHVLGGRAVDRRRRPPARGARRAALRRRLRRRRRAGAAPEPWWPRGPPIPRRLRSPVVYWYWLWSGHHP